MYYLYMIDFAGVFVGACMCRHWLMVLVVMTGLSIGATCAWPELAGLPWWVLLGGMIAVYAGGLALWFYTGELVLHLQLRREQRRHEAEQAKIWPPPPGPRSPL